MPFVHHSYSESRSQNQQQLATVMSVFMCELRVQSCKVLGLRLEGVVFGIGGLRLWALNALAA